MRSTKNCSYEGLVHWRRDREGEGNRPADEYRLHDAGANLTAFARMDGAWLGSIEIGINRAFTAKALDISTLELGRNSQPGDQFFGSTYRTTLG